MTFLELYCLRVVQTLVSKRLPSHKAGVYDCAAAAANPHSPYIIHNSTHPSLITTLCLIRQQDPQAARACATTHTAAPPSDQLWPRAGRGCNTPAAPRQSEVRARQ